MRLDGNPTLLKELIRNLVDNAINYTPSSDARPGVITARVLAGQEGSALQLQVEDNGPGVGPNERELVFQPFYRMEASRNKETGGNGLGLPITRNIARAHGGDVVLSNRQGGGARATVTLPL